MGAKPGLMAMAVIGLLAAGCGTPMRWDKAGATAEDVDNDRLECRRAASDEAFRMYPVYSGFGLMGPPYGGWRHRPDYYLWRQQGETDRVFYEMRLASFCMRNKGYTQVPITPEAAPAK